MCYSTQLIGKRQEILILKLIILAQLCLTQYQNIINASEAKNVIIHLSSTNAWTDRLLMEENTDVKVEIVV